MVEITVDSRPTWARRTEGLLALALLDLGWKQYSPERRG